MNDSRLNETERNLQPRFSLAGLAGAVLIAAIIALVSIAWSRAPNRFPLPSRTVSLTAERLAIIPADVSPLRIAGAWQLTALDPRFGGLSALAIDRGRLLALNDSGIVFRFSPPGHGPSTVAIAELPDGPGSASLKSDRDSESIARDAEGRGWWVGFETTNQLWLYSPDLRRALRTVDLGRARWTRNLGPEAILADRSGLIIIDEPASEVVAVRGGQVLSQKLAGVGYKIADMVRLPNGETIVLMRDFGLGGFRNALGALVRTPAGWRVERRVPLALGAFMNAEGIAAQPLADGATRLWLVTDDNFRTPMTTALFALDVPPGRWTGRQSN